jgi:pimeloyl-ACP methyl ester carboxylesterase
VLQDAGLATLLMDLLTAPEDEAEARGAMRRFDIGVLAERLVDATTWVGSRSDLPQLPIGYFGASTGAGAALVAAAELGEQVSVVVSRGGRPDLAGEALGRVTAPTLLVVGGNDHAVIEMNAAALEQLRCTKRFDIVPGASHLFEEPGTLEQVAQLARDWFLEHF